MRAREKIEYYRKRRKEKLTIVGRVKTMLEEKLVKKLLEEELKHCDSFLRNSSTPRWPKKMPLTEFVERSFMLHRRLIERWGGWRYHGEPVLCDDCDVIEQITLENWRAFIREMAADLRRREYGPEDYRAAFHIHTSSHPRGPRWMGLGSKVFESRYIEEGIAHRFTEKAKLTVSLGTLVVRDSTRRRLNIIELTGEARVGQRVAAVVGRILEEYKVAEHSPWVAKGWERLLVRQGETVWAGKQTHVACTLSCAPSSFLKLGHYGEASCYGNGGGQDHSKAFLSADMPDSFVALFYRNTKIEELEPKERNVKTKVSGRGWGVAVPEKGGFVSNFYLLSRESVQSALLRAAQDGLGIDKPVLEASSTMETHSRIYGLSAYLTRRESLYLNPDWSLFYGPSRVKAQFVEYYLRKIFEYSTTYGVYTKGGHGPDMRDTVDGESIEPSSRLVTPVIWPYKDTPLREIITSKGPVLI